MRWSVRMCLVAAIACLAVRSNASAAVDIALSPSLKLTTIGGIVEINIVVKASGDKPEPFDALDAIIIWDPAYLFLLGASQDNAGAAFFLTGFLPDPDGVNANLFDGNAIYTALAFGGFTVDAPPGPDGLIVTTLLFFATNDVDSTLVSFQPTIGAFGKTRVLLAGAEVTGVIGGPAKVVVEGGSACPSPGNCFEFHKSAGCEDAECCEAVCSIDPFCCDTSWDSICVDEASELCDGCGDPAAGDCCSPHDTPFCDNRACCDVICAFDPFCCDVEWDKLCAGYVDDFPECDCAGDPCKGSDENCFVAHDTPGCNDPDCCAAVCAVDPFCCEVEWDGICKDEANSICGNCGSPNAGSCYCPHNTVGCNNAGCCRDVCAADPFCCEVQWDGICVNEAKDICCPFDFNNDGIVDGGDYGLMLAAWGTGTCPFDVNGDGTVNGADTGLLLAAWGECD